MTRLYNDPEHRRQRAEEARAIASKMTDHRGKEAVLKIAEKYADPAQPRLRIIDWLTGLHLHDACRFAP